MRRDEIARNRGLKRKALFKYQTERVRKKWIFYFRTCSVFFSYKQIDSCVLKRVSVFSLSFYYYYLVLFVFLLFVLFLLPYPRHKEQREQLLSELNLFSRRSPPIAYGRALFSTSPDLINAANASINEPYTNAIGHWRAAQCPTKKGGENMQILVNSLTAKLIFLN